MRNRLLFIVLSFLTAISGAVVYGQKVRRYTAADGMLGADVTAICENEHYLWIATNEGLNRFDGREFKTYKKENGCNNCLSESNIETMMFDSEGLLWIGYKAGGVDIYDPKKDQFFHISRFLDKYPHRVISIFEDSKKNIWLGSWEEGLYQLIPLQDQTLQYEVKIHLAGLIVSSIIEKPDSILWVGSYNGCFGYDIKKDKWIALEDNDLWVTQLLDSGDNNSIWATTWKQGLLKISWENTDFTNIRVRHFMEGHPNLYRLYPAGPDRMYLGSWGEGLGLVENQTDKVIERQLKSDLQASVILSFFRDRYNKFWIGTYGNGLFRMNTEDEGVRYLDHFQRNGFAADFKILPFGQNRVLIGTQGEGLFLYDLKNEKIIPKKTDYLHNTLFSNYILSLYCDDNLLIVGHDDIGLYYATLNENKDIDFRLKQFFADSELAKVTSIFKYQSKIWLGTKQNGLISVEYDSVRHTFDNYVHYSSFIRDEITGFAVCDTNRLWVSSHGGLYLFDVEKGTYEGESPFVKDMIYNLFNDTQNKCLWLGTSVGLKRLDYSGEIHVEQAFSTNFLPEGAILNLSHDDENNLWFSIANRVFCFSIDTHLLREVNTSVFSDRIFQSSSTAEIDGKKIIIFGGAGSPLLIEPHVALSQSGKNNIVFTELQIDHQKISVGQKVHGRVVLNEATEYVSSLSLSYLSKWISLSFSETGNDHFRNKYRYLIEGFTDNWQYSDFTKPLTFSQLQPGEYTLFIRQYDTEPSKESSYRLSIQIRPPWWRTVWFRTISAFLTVIALVLFTLLLRAHYRKRQNLRLIEIEKKKKEELLQEKESFFAGLSHDLLTPFSLIIAPATDLLREKDITSERREKLEIISRNAAYLSDIFNSMLDLKRTEIVDSELHERNADIVQLCRMIAQAFDYMAKTKHIDLVFSSSVSRLMLTVDTVKVERILYNLLSNALKFTPEGGSIRVSLNFVNDVDFQLEVSDTGVGIDVTNLSKVFDKFYQGVMTKDKHINGLGLGLYIVRRFVNMLGGTVWIDSGEGKGTAVGISLPVRLLPEIATVDERLEADERPTILLVEDNKEMLDYLCGKLSVFFIVTTASNGVEALDFVRKQIPEIVISDVMMPEMDGLALCETVKNTPILSDIFVVLLSAKSSIEDKMLGYKAGADLYIEKPFDSDNLIKQILNIYTTRLYGKKQIINEFIISEQSGNADTVRKDDFLGKAVRIIEAHLMEEEFRIDDFAVEMNMSKSVLHRKFKHIIGETPNIFIRNIRLHKASEMLKSTSLSVSEIAYLTGFSQSHYFIKCFKELYRETPGNYRKLTVELKLRT